MSTVQNVSPVTAEKLLDVLKNEFGNYIDTKLDTNLAIGYAHVYDVINVSFPEIIEGTVFTIIVNDMSIELSDKYSLDVFADYRLYIRRPGTDYHVDRWGTGGNFTGNRCELSHQIIIKTDQIIRGANGLRKPLAYKVSGGPITFIPQAS